jgi:hypothetical protein
MTSDKNRSGTKWTEADYQAANMERMNLRLPLDDASRLRRLAKFLGISRAKVVSEALIELEKRKCK